MILQLLIAWLATKIHHHQDQVIRYLREENRILKAKLKGRRIPLTDTERRRLAVLAYSIDRKDLKDLSTIATPDTLQWWYRRLVVHAPSRKPQGKRLGRPRVAAEIELLAVRMATENPRWGYRRIQGALANLGYHIDNTTVCNILRRNHINPAPIRGRASMSWSQFLRLHLEVLQETDVCAALTSTVASTWTVAITRTRSIGARCVQLVCLIQHGAMSMLALGARQCDDLWARLLVQRATRCASVFGRQERGGGYPFPPSRLVLSQRVPHPLKARRLGQERSPPETKRLDLTLNSRRLTCGRGASIHRLLVVSTVQSIASNSAQSIGQSRYRGSCQDSYPAAA